MGKVLIFIQGKDGIKRFFNRRTQGFTSRLGAPNVSHDIMFYDWRRPNDATIPVEREVLFTDFRRHKSSFEIWEAMAESDESLTYNKITLDRLKRGF